MSPIREVRDPALPDHELFVRAEPATGRVIVIAPTRAACETIELAVQLHIETYLEKRHGARVRELEAELVEVQARANAAVAEWQERAYWLDRWHLDLNALMRRRGAAEFRALVRAVRSVLWTVKRARRRLRGQ